MEDMDDFRPETAQSISQETPEQTALLLSTFSLSVPSDSIFDRKNLAKFDQDSVVLLHDRNVTYSDILKGYSAYALEILQKNPKRQTCFFWISLALLIASPVQFFGVLFHSETLLAAGLSTEAVVPVAVGLIASGAEVVSALLVFPKIIAEYLFNTNETTSINSVISAIQSYDVAVRGGIRHTVENGMDKPSDQNDPTYS